MATSTTAAKIKANAALADEFQALLKTWRDETLGHWNAANVLAHPAHQRIVEMGEGALPLIFADLAAGGGYWWRALRTITGTSPISEEDMGRSSKMRAAWLQWARDHGYLREDS